MSNKYSKAIINLRKHLELTQAEFAEKIGVSRQTVNYMEKNEKQITPRILDIIKEKYGDITNYIDADCEDLKARFRYMRIEIICLSQIKLGERLGVASQTITDIESGHKKKINDDILKKLIDEYCINIEWLLFGIGNPTKIDDEEDSYNKYYNEQVAFIKKYDFNLSEEENKTRNTEDKDTLYFDKRWLSNILGVNPDNIFFIYAPDDSMDSGMDTLKDIKKGDILFIDTSQKKGNDKVFVYKNDFDNKPSIRQIKWSLSENIKLIPYNEKYKSGIVEKQLNEFMINIIGKVIWNGSKEG